MSSLDNSKLVKTRASTEYFFEFNILVSNGKLFVNGDWVAKVVRAFNLVG